MKLLLKAGTNVNAVSWRGTALHLAEIGPQKIVNLLLNTGADTNSQNQRGETALHIAVAKNYLGIVKLLLKAGANVNAENRAGTALYIARDLGHVEIVQTLLAAVAIE